MPVLVSATAAEVNVSVPEPPMSLLAKKIPADSKSSGVAEATEKAFEREAKVQVCNYMEAMPAMAQDLACFAKSLWVQEHSRGVHGPEALQDVTHVEVYDENWKCAYVASKLGVTTETLGLAKVRDRKIVCHVVRTLLNSSALLKLPQSCKDRAVMA